MHPDPKLREVTGAVPEARGSGPRSDRPQDVRRPGLRPERGGPGLCSGRTEPARFVSVRRRGLARAGLPQGPLARRPARGCQGPAQTSQRGLSTALAIRSRSSPRAPPLLFQERDAPPPDLGSTTRRRTAAEDSEQRAGGRNKTPSVLPRSQPRCSRRERRGPRGLRAAQASVMSLAPEPSVCSKPRAARRRVPAGDSLVPAGNFLAGPLLGVPSPPLGIPSLTARSLAPAGGSLAGRSVAARSPPAGDSLAGRSVAARSYHQHSLESRAMRVECRRIRLQRRRHPNTPTRRRTHVSAARAGNSRYNSPTQSGRPESRSGRCEANLRPADRHRTRHNLLGSTSDRAATERSAREPPAGASEGIPSGGARSGTAAAPDGRMLEQTEPVR